MWKCPVCDQENNAATVCPRCGYDRTCDYERYPTAFAVTTATPTHTLRRQWQEKQGPSPEQWYERYWQETDTFKRLAYLRTAAEQGYAPAQTELGLCYENGKGVEQDEAQAVRWYRKAAQQGYPWAQCNLGLCYEYGRGVEQDTTMAVQWYRKAAEQGNKNAQLALADCYENGLGVPKNPSLARYWQEKAKNN